MPIHFIDGFDLYGDSTADGLGNVWSIDGTVTFSTTSGRFGGGGVACNSLGEGIYRGLTTTDTYFAMGAAIKTPASLGTSIPMYCTDTADVDVNDGNAGIRLNADGSVSLVGDGGITIATSATGVWSPNSWYYMELIFQRSASGTGFVYFNGVEIVSGTGDLSESTAGPYFCFGQMTNTTLVNTIDDVYVASDPSTHPTPLGDVRIDTLLPNGDTATADWTGSYTDIDDALGTNGDGDTTFINATTLNHKSTFDFGALGVTPDAIHGVQLTAKSKKTDAGAIEYTTYIDSNGTEEVGVAVVPSEAAYGVHYSFHNTNPDGGGAWTITAIDALKAGVEITA